MERRVNLEAISRRPRVCEQALLLPLGDEKNSPALALLCGRRGQPVGEALERARFVARNAGLALNNVVKIASANSLAYVDDLTRLFNTRYLNMILDREISLAVGTNGTFSLLFFDLDRFKEINDEHGHLIGSKLLVEVGRVIRSCVRDIDVVCRWGGDEFAVVLFNTDSGGALKVAERIRQAIAEQAFLAREGLRLRTTTCIGIATFPEHALDRQGILDLADRAMYRGKRSTRNVVYMATPDAPAPPPDRSIA